MNKIRFQQNTTYDQIGRSYDETRSADPEIIATISNLLKSTPKGHYLDIGCGSGNYTVALTELDLYMTGVDISEEMLSKARKKSKAITWVNGDAKKLKFSDQTFDGAICILATHHIQALDKAFSETYRVLKPNAYFVIFTSTPEQMHGYWLCHYFPKMMAESCKIMANENELRSDLTKAGFSNIVSEKFFVTNDLKDWFLHAGKYRPEIYLDPVVRAGISTFAKTQHTNEIVAGLQALKNDIDNQKVQSIIDKYENRNGDYLFICAATD